MKHIKTIKAGPLVKQVIYTTASPHDSPRTRAARSKATSAAQARLNKNNSKEQLEMLIAENFNLCDYFLTLTFDEDHIPHNKLKTGKDKGVASATKDIAEMRKKVRAYFKLLRPLYKHNGRELKYVYAPQGIIEGRYHIHMVISAPCEDIEKSKEMLQSLWPEGFSQIKPLSSYYETEGRYIDYARIAGYMVREHGVPAGMRLWTRSRNLVNPTIERVESVPESATIATPAGCFQLEKEEQCNPYGGYTFIKYVYPLELDRLHKGP